jgi:ketosteroid isomerase-like protein
MSAQENKAAAQAAYQAFDAGDLEGAMRDLADDIEWIVPGNSTVSGTYRGKDEVAGFFATLAGKSFRTEPQHFIADGDHVVVLTRTTSEGEMSADQADVLTFRDGKVVKFQSAGDTALMETIWGKK